MQFSKDKVYSRKRRVYLVATMLTMCIFLPFRSNPWAIYAGVCAGYTVLVFGLRRAARTSKSSGEDAGPVSRLLLVHAAFLAVVVGWVWLGLALRPYLPYILTTEDTTHPYFGLAFLGIVGLLMIELAEQHQLRAVADSALSLPAGSASDVNKDKEVSEN